LGKNETILKIFSNPEKLQQGQKISVPLHRTSKEKKKTKIYFFDIE